MAAGAGERLRARDVALWRIDVAARRDGDELLVEVRTRDWGGRPCVDAKVAVTLFHDDFFCSAESEVRSDGDGTARVRFAGALARGERRFVHITAGDRFPRAEAALAVEF
jgi:hypothetical protein